MNSVKIKIGRGRGRLPKSREIADSEIKEITTLRLGGLSFSEIGKQFGKTKGWASKIFYNEKEKNKILLGAMVDGLMRCPKHPPIWEKLEDRFKGGRS